MNRQALLVLRTVIPLAVLAAAGAGAVVMIRAKPPVETRPPGVLPPLVRIQEVTLEDLSLTVTGQGTVSPRTESQLVPEVSGRVIWVSPSFASGGFFDAGATLLKIDPYDYDQAIVRAEADLARAKLRLAQEEAEAEVARDEWAELGTGTPTPLTLREPQVADATAAVAAEASSLERARRDRDRTEIKAPYSGRLRQKQVDVGQFVTIGAPVASVYAVDYAEIRLPLADDELAYLDLPLVYRGGSDQQRGPSVTLRADFAGKTHEWSGRIVRTEGEIDPQSRMVHAVAQVRNPYGRGDDPDRPPLAVGMYVEAEIQGRVAEQVAVLPRAALRGTDEILIVDDEDRLRFRTVDLLRKTDETIVVRAGLAAGERVCLSPLEAVSDGMRVRTQDTPAEGDRTTTEGRAS